MAIVDLSVRDFRNITAAELRFSPQLNLITGHNGAGKTSLLEALYVLGRAQSFRTSQAATLIREGAPAFLLRGHVTAESGAPIAVGMQRDHAGLQVRLAGRPVTHLSELLPYFPFQVFTPDSHQLLEGGPRYRRKFLDWGVFHVEHNFFPAWQRFSRALRQRNAALRGAVRPDEIRLWDRELAQAGEVVDALRRAYLADLLPVLRTTVADLVGLTELDWDYRSGWNRKAEYAAVLADSLEGDLRQGFTRSGPHRADLLPLIAGQPAHERVSRGQQKQVAIALLLAQAAVYGRRTDRACTFLVDDLASELDRNHRERVLQHLFDLRAQVFLTAIDAVPDEFRNWPEPAVFHVEHGQVQE